MSLSIGIIIACFKPSLFIPKYILCVTIFHFIALIYLAPSSSKFRFNPFEIFSSLSWILVGMYSYSSTLPEHLPHHFSNFHSPKKLAIMLDQCQLKTRSIQCQGKVLFIKKENHSWIKSSGKILVYMPDKGINPTDYNHQWIISEAPYDEIEAPKNPLAFSFKDYNAKKSIYHQTFIKSGRVFVLKGAVLQEDRITNWFGTAQSFFANNLKRYLPDASHHQIAMALTLGYKEELARETRDLFADTGAMHILAVSGLHVGMICLLLLGFFKILKIPESIKLLLTLISIWSYAILTGASPSVIRACIMFSPILLAKSLSIQHKHSSLNALALAGIFILLFDPHSIFQLSFQFSFIAVAGILLLYKRFNQLWNPSNKIIKYFWDLSCVSLSAQIALFPLSIYYFHQFPVYFLLSNFIAIPAAFLILILSIGLLLCDWIVPGITYIFQFTLTECLNILLTTLGYINDLPFAKLDKLWISQIEVIIWYGILVLLINYLIHRRKIILAGTFAVAVSLMIVSTIDTAYHTKQKKLIIYHHRKGFHIDFLFGSTCFRWTKEVSPKSQQYASKNFLTSTRIKNHQNIDDISLSTILQIIDSNTIEFCKKQIKILSSNASLHFEKEQQISFVLLHNNPKLNLQDISVAFPNAKIIALASNYKYLLDNWSRQGSQLGIQFYSCATEGAFIYKMN
jgi:competence protein ComEC